VFIRLLELSPSDIVQAVSIGLAIKCKLITKVPKKYRIAQIKPHINAKTKY